MKRERSIGDLLFDWTNIVVLVIVSFMFVFPFYIVLINSITVEQFLTAGSLSIWPEQVTFKAYHVLFSANSKIITAFIVSVASTVIGTIQGMFVITLFAYAMSKEFFPFKKTIMILLQRLRSVIPSMHLSKHLK